MKKLPEILTIPAPILRQQSRKVEKFDQQLQELVKTLTQLLKIQKDPLGLGLSAPQIGVLKRVFVVRAPVKIKPFVNPEIVKFSKKKVAMLEGCLSIPLYFGHVIRPAEVEVAAYDVNGKKFQETYDGLTARAIQHEIDHLNGILFIDHVHDQNGKLYRLQKTKNGKEKLVEVTHYAT